MYRGSIGKAERRPVPRADDASLSRLDRELAVGQRAGQVRALVGEDVDVLATPYDEQVHPVDGALGRRGVGQVVERAEVLPAPREGVGYVGAVIGARSRPEDEVAAEVAAGHDRAEPGVRQPL